MSRLEIDDFRLAIGDWEEEEKTLKKAERGTKETGT